MQRKSCRSRCGSSGATGRGSIGVSAEAFIISVQRGKAVVGIVPGDASEVTFDLTRDAVIGDAGDGDDFRGSYVHGTRGAFTGTIRAGDYLWGDSRQGSEFQVAMRDENVRCRGTLPIIVNGPIVSVFASGTYQHPPFSPARSLWVIFGDPLDYNRPA